MRTFTRAGIALNLILIAGCPSDSTGLAMESGNGDVTGTATAAASDDDASGSTTCTEPETQVAFTVDGTLVEPMGLGLAEMLGIEVARSWSAELGTVTLNVSTACSGPLHLWALVWDSTGGIEPENADSLYMSIDGGSEEAWIYGCSTDEELDGQWYWLPVESWTMTQCTHTPWAPYVPAGDHSIVIRNREGGGGIDVAAIAAVVVSHDPSIDPSEFFPLGE